MYSAACGRANLILKLMEKMPFRGMEFDCRFEQRGFDFRLAENRSRQPWHDRAIQEP
jgi:hypothetical protein